MWYLENIPKILHLYWGRNKKLSFMRYVTARSFAKLNKDWEIRVYHPRQPCSREAWQQPMHKNYAYEGKDHFDDLHRIKNVTVEMVDFEKKLQVREKTPEVWKSDILRWHLLSTVGGVWSDFDIVYIKPMSAFALNRLKYAETHVILCNFSVGFLMGGGRGRKLYSRLFHSAMSRYETNLKYEGLGSLLLRRFPLLNKYPSEPVMKWHGDTIIRNMPRGTVYPYLEIEDFYKTGERLNRDRDTIGWHWLAGNSITPRYENVVDRQNIQQYSELSLVREMLRAIK